MANAPSSHWVLVYDGDCTFCKYTVDYAAAVVGDSVRFEPYQRVASDYSQVALDEFKASTDFDAIERGVVTVTPLLVDLTRHDSLPQLKNWLES